MATYLIDRKNLHFVHLCDNQFALRGDFVYLIEKEYRDYRGVWHTTKEKYTKEDTGYEGEYYPSLVTLRVDLFTFLNKTYGTSYEVTDEMRKYADSFRGKLQDLYNIGIEVGWRFTEYGGFYHRYRYDSENGRSLGVVESTYGDDWTKEQLIALADALVEFFKTDPLAIAKAAMQEHYSMEREFGIGHREDPLYSDGTQEYFPAKGETTICRTMLR